MDLTDISLFSEEEAKPKAATPKKQQQKQQPAKKGGKKRKLQEDEEEEKSAEDEQPAKKKRRFSMPYISAEDRKRRYIQFFDTLVAETKVKPVVAIHALIVYSGNVNLARQYLLNKGGTYHQKSATDPIGSAKFFPPFLFG